jgi:YbbR domain-containing protein
MAYHPFRHLGLKVLAVALATLLWLTVAGEHVVERSLRVPLEFRNIPAQLEIVGDPPASVDVRLRGSSSTLGRLDAGEVVAVLDLSSARPGPRLFHITAEEIRTPYGVEVSQVVPSTLSLEMERSASRMVPIVPAIEGEPAPGFVIGRMTSEPATVLVVGPESRLRQLANATTEPVVVTGSRDRVRDVVTVGVADSSLRLAEAQRATVVIEVWPAPVERDITGVPIRYRNLAGGLKAVVSPGSAKVSLRGRKESVAGLADSAIDAFVDLAGLGAGRYNLRVQVDPAEHYGVSGISPSVVEVTIR